MVVLEGSRGNLWEPFGASHGFPSHRDDELKSTRYASTLDELKCLRAFVSAVATYGYCVMLLAAAGKGWHIAYARNNNETHA